MADLTPYPDPNGDTGVDPDRGSATTTPSYPGAPRWLNVSGIVALVLVPLLVVLMFASGGNHGPGRHTPSGGASGYTSPAARLALPR